VYGIDRIVAIQLDPVLLQMHALALVRTKRLDCASEV
jgi:hypothetical protein